MKRKQYVKPSQTAIDLADEICGGILIPQSDATPGVSDVKGECQDVWEDSTDPKSKSLWDNIWG